MHRSALGAGALSDEWARERLPRHTGRDGFVFLAARFDKVLVGFGYGYTGAHGQWWTDHVARALTSAQRDEWLDPPHFEIVELRPAGVPARRDLAALAQLLTRQPHGRAAPLDAAELPQGARFLREERVARACRGRLRVGYPLASSASEWCLGKRV